MILKIWPMHLLPLALLASLLSVAEGGTNPDSSPLAFVKFRNMILFNAADAFHGRELWRYVPATDTTELVKDIAPGLLDGIDIDAGSVVAAEYAVFLAGRRGYDLGIWGTDGTAEGTRQLLPSDWGDASERPYLCPLLANKAPFFVFESGRGWSLHSTNGTVEGTVILQAACDAIRPLRSSLLVAPPLGSALGFQPNCPPELRSFVTDGSVRGTRSLAPQPAVLLDPRCVNVDGKVFFSAKSEEAGWELWIWEEAASLLRMVRDIMPGPGDSTPSQFISFNHRVFFQAAEPEHGPELWSSDGTAAGTEVLDLIPGPAGIDPYSMQVCGPYLYFSADDGDHGREMWRSDGTLEGTFMLTDLWPGPESSHPYQPKTIRGRLLFGAKHPKWGEELWSTDGTEEGTRLVKDIWRDTGHGEPYHLTAIDDVLYFSANDGVRGREFWRSDGTAEGTHILADINPAPGPSPAGQPRLLTPAAEGVYFTAMNRQGQRDYWFSDGTAEGTRELAPVEGEAVQLCAAEKVLVALVRLAPNEVRLHRISDGKVMEVITPRLSPDQRLISTEPEDGGRKPAIYFAAEDAEHGEELWRLTAPYEAAELAIDLAEGSVTYTPRPVLTVGGQLYVTAQGKGNGRELWTYDDALSRAVAAAPGLLNPRELVGAAGVIYCVAEKERVGPELWRVNPVGEPVLLRNIYPDISRAGSAETGFRRAAANPETSPAPAQLRWSGNQLFFTARDTEHGIELWKSDGTPEGTVLLKDLYPGSGSSAPASLCVLEEVLFFSAESPVHGRRLWRSDGTEAGTYPLAKPGRVLFAPSQLTACGKYIAFTAESTEMPGGLQTGRELFLTDGTAEGIRLIADLNPGLAGGLPGELTPVHGNLFYCANDGYHGEELWLYDTETKENRLVRDLLPPVKAARRRTE